MLELTISWGRVVGTRRTHSFKHVLFFSIFIFFLSNIFCYFSIFNVVFKFACKVSRCDLFKGHFAMGWLFHSGNFQFSVFSAFWCFGNRSACAGHLLIV